MKSIQILMFIWILILIHISSNLTFIICSTSVFQLIMSMSMFFNPAPLQSNTQEIWRRKKIYINGKLWNMMYSDLKSFNICLFQLGVILWHKLFFLQIALSWIYFWLSAFIHPLQAKVNGGSIIPYFAWIEQKCSCHVQKNYDRYEISV